MHVYICICLYVHPQPHTTVHSYIHVYATGSPGTMLQFEILLATRYTLQHTLYTETHTATHTAHRKTHSTQKHALQHTLQHTPHTETSRTEARTATHTHNEHTHKRKHTHTHAHKHTPAGRRPGPVCVYANPSQSQRSQSRECRP